MLLFQFGLKVTPPARPADAGHVETSALTALALQPSAKEPFLW